MDNILNTYAAYAKDKKLRLLSSSGAIFSLLAEQILLKNGIVYGVAMSKDCRYAEFMRIDNQNDLSKLRGSKYIQAKIGNTYKQVKSDLNSGLYVLFSGTGCQINGLKLFLGEKYEKLYCVDVICHGVPSPKLWKKYVEYVEEEEKATLINVNFRCKKYGWSDFGIKRIDGNHKTVYISKDKDPYMLMFLRDYSLRPSCYECKVKKHKLSDLTIADFWGINEILPKMNDGRGISLVIIRSEKGHAFFDSIKENIIHQEVSYEDGIKRNQAEFKSVKRPDSREAFFSDMNSMSFEELKNKYAIPSKLTLKRKTKLLIKKIISKLTITNFYRWGGVWHSFHIGRKIKS